MGTYPQSSLTSYPTYPIREMVVDSSISSPFENGMVQARPRYTRQRKKWSLSYRALTEDEKNSVSDFYNSMLGGSYYFTWVNPMTEVSHTVRFSGNLEITQITGSYYTVSFDLEEL